MQELKASILEYVAVEIGFIERVRAPSYQVRPNISIVSPVSSVEHELP